MKSKEIIRAFIDSLGKHPQEPLIGPHLEYIGNKLYSYGICLARFEHNMLYIDAGKFNQAISKHRKLLQNTIRLDIRYKNESQISNATIYQIDSSNINS